jgi:hypothetical protein
MTARLRSHQLTTTVLIKLIKGISKKLKSDKDKTVFSHKVLVVVCIINLFISLIVLSLSDFNFFEILLSVLLRELL